MQASLAAAGPVTAKKSQVNNANSGAGRKGKRSARGGLNAVSRSGPRLWCRNCEMANHSTEECRKKPEQYRQTRVESTPVEQCQLCDRKGHIAKDCRRRPPVTCYGCGQLGHMKPQCPNSRPHYSRGYSQPSRGHFQQPSLPMVPFHQSQAASNQASVALPPGAIIAYPASSTSFPRSEN